MIIPSIDIMDGKAVQLRQGRTKVLERDNPLELAHEFGRYAPIALIDLDAAFGTGDNETLIRDICSQHECRVGGGIRTVEKAERMFSHGASRVIVGSKVFENDRVNIRFLTDLSRKIGRQHITVAVDSWGETIVTDGWRHKTGIAVTEALRMIRPFCAHVLFTCVKREGMMQGVDFEALETVRAATDLQITAAGGITTMDEITRLADMGCNAQTGMSLYTGKISLPDAVIASLNWGKTPLMPTVTTDTTGQVLMLAYMSRESLRETFKSGSMTYFSRSRDRLWKKGETSGNVQTLHSIRTDCDRDTLLAVVAQTGNACHLGDYSCFGDRRFSLDQLLDLLSQKIETAEPGSYTASLTAEKLREKIMEEAGEVCDATDRDNKVWELSDIMYFLTVYMAREGISFDEVRGELRRRRRS